MNRLRALGLPRQEAVSHVRDVISELDDCLEGNWRVPRSAFESLTEYLAAAQVLQAAP